METTKPWIKGSLPQWIVVILLAIIGFFGRRTLEEIDNVRSRQTVNEARITKLETSFESLHELIVDMKTNQRDALTELRALNIKLSSKN
jgi:hypothetical protein